MMTGFKKIICSAVLLSLCACSQGGYYPFLYHAPVSQGNDLDPKSVAQLRPGMSKARLENYLGSPVLKTTLASRHESIYVYYFDKKNGKPAERRVFKFYFDASDKLTYIQQF